MATEKICIHCVYFPLCHAIWSVCATHPCRHIGFGSVGFFRHKADEERIRRETIEECKGAVANALVAGTSPLEAVCALAERNSRGNESY